MLTIDALPPQQQIEYVVMQDARAVNDTARFSFTDYDVDGVSAWAVVMITPDPDSGSATIPGGYIDTETGTLVVPPGQGMVIMKKGTWKLLSAAQSAFPPSGTYSWNEPLEENKRILGPEDFYSPSIQGGTLLFQPNPAGKGIDQFRHPRVIFSQWKDMVQPAFAYSMQIGSVLDGSATEKDIGMLTELMSQSNTLLSIFALRELLRLRSIAPQAARGLLYGKDDRLKAVFVFLMLTASSADEWNDWLNQIIRLVNEANDPEDLYIFELSAFAVLLFRSRDSEAVAGGNIVLATVKTRLGSLQVPVGKAPRLHFIP